LSKNDKLQEQEQGSCECPFCEEPVCPVPEEIASFCRVTLITCPSCNKTLQEDALLCPHCGKAITGRD